LKTDSFKLNSSDGLKIHINRWLPPKSSKAVLQIAHGMAEHSQRYNDFGSFMADNGFSVYANDHRGHGRTAGSIDQMGFCSQQNGWQLMLGDMHFLTGYIKERHPGTPVFLLGHSMGTLLARNYAFYWGDQIKGLLLSGVNSYQPALTILGLIISFILATMKGKEAKSPFLNNMLFGGYNKFFKPARTGFDWLCSDQKVVDRYIEDKYCGAVFSAGFFYDLAKATINIHKMSNIKKTPKNLPILMLCGENDPVGSMAKGAAKVYQSYKRTGIKDISFKVYKGSRHEILNEKTKSVVYHDILAWTGARL